MFTTFFVNIVIEKHPRTHWHPFSRNMSLKVAIPNFNHPPDYVKSEVNGEWSGLFIDVLEELSIAANFRLN